MGYGRSGQSRARQLRADGASGEICQQQTLEPRVVGGGVRPLTPLMMTVVAVGGKPLLRQVSQAQVVRCPGATHFGWHPARIDGVAVHLAGHSRVTAAASVVTKNLLSE